MEVMQYTIFDCDDIVRESDCVLNRLKGLLCESEIQIGELEVRRSARFYCVAKDAEWELLFANVEDCYEFVNRTLSKDLLGRERNVGNHKKENRQDT